MGAVLAWVVAVGAATAVAMVAIGAVGSGIVDRGPRPLSQAEVAEQLAAAQAPSTTAQPTPGPTSQTTLPETTAAQPEPQARALPSAGGTVVARCIPHVDIVSTAPAQGYRLESIEPDDGATRVRFRSSSGGQGDGRVEVYVRCVAGEPTAS